MKIKIFQSTDIDDLKNDVNEFLTDNGEGNKLEFKEILQSESSYWVKEEDTYNGGHNETNVTITVIYRD